MAFEEEIQGQNPRNPDKKLRNLRERKREKTLLKFCTGYCYKVTKVPWGSPPPRTRSLPSTYGSNGLDVAFQPIYLAFYWI